MPAPKVSAEVKMQIEQAAKREAMVRKQDVNLLTDGVGFKTELASNPIPEGWELVQTFSGSVDLLGLGGRF